MTEYQIEVVLELMALRAQVAVLKAHAHSTVGSSTLMRAALETRISVLSNQLRDTAQGAA